MPKKCHKIWNRNTATKVSPSGADHIIEMSQKFIEIAQKCHINSATEILKKCQRNIIEISTECYRNVTEM